LLGHQVFEDILDQYCRKVRTAEEKRLFDQATLDAEFALYAGDYDLDAARRDLTDKAMRRLARNEDDIVAFAYLKVIFKGFSVQQPYREASNSVLWKMAALEYSSDPQERSSFRDPGKGSALSRPPR
jgi:hypothetical protein